MSRIDSVMIALLAAAVIAVAAHGGVNTNAAVTAKAPEPVTIGHLVFEGGDGSSVEQAVIVKNAKNEEEGVGAEAKWIGKVHAGWKKGDQALLNKNGKYYDRVEYATPNGKKETVFFDITAFFGK